MTSISLQIFIDIEMKFCLALYRSSFLTLIWPFTACEIAHFGYNGAHISSGYAKNVYWISHPSNRTNIRTRVLV